MNIIQIEQADSSMQRKWRRN